MGLQLVPGFISGGGTYQHPVELFRNLMKGLSAGGQKGTLTPASFSLTPSGSLMQLTVGAGYAVVSGEENTTQGSYFVWSNASEVLAWPSHPVSNSRWDTLVLRVIDTQYGVDASPNGAYWEICQGTAAASPTKITDSEFQSGGDFYRPGAWYRVADVLVQSTDLNMAATDITSYLALANPYHARGEIGYALQQTIYYPSGGTFVKASYPYARKLRVKAQAGGGGGGGAIGTASGAHAAAGGGGAGGYAEGWLDVAGLASSVTITTGTGGAGGNGTTPSDGVNGNSSSFGTAVVATGGSGGGRGTSTTADFGGVGSAGGIGTAGDLLIRGGTGGYGNGTAGTALGGPGGQAQLGGGAAGSSLGSAGQVAGTVGGNYGGGGSGGITANGTLVSGGAGAPGMVIVEIYG